jgi:hypothetical protein
MRRTEVLASAKSSSDSISTEKNWALWLMPVIPPTWKTEIRRTGSRTAMANSS